MTHESVSSRRARWHAPEHAIVHLPGRYQNQVVHIGFRNDSNDDFVLILDDIRVTQ